MTQGPFYWSRERRTMRKFTIFLLVAAICGPIYRYSTTPANLGIAPDTSRTETQVVSNIAATALPYFHGANEVETATPIEFPEEVMYYTEDEVLMIARVLQLECGSLLSLTEQACVAWTILNRADWYDMSVSEVVVSPNQFAYNENVLVADDLMELAEDVLSRWSKGKSGETDVGRVLPQEYMWFWGDGEHNYFRDAYNGAFTVWDYSLPSPYES